MLVTVGIAQARLREDQFDLPVRVFDAYGKTIEHTIKVTVFSDDVNPRPAPVLVLNHGRAVEPEDRVKVGRARFSDASKFFVQRGFIVAVPTRIGYGVSGGEDVEYSGACNRKNYPPGYAAAAAQTLAVLEAVRQRSDAAKNRAVVMGQSYGGATAATVASLNPPGVQASINFAGAGEATPQPTRNNPASRKCWNACSVITGQRRVFPCSGSIPKTTCTLARSCLGSGSTPTWLRVVRPR
jgi:dienelactone hydrolase